MEWLNALADWISAKANRIPIGELSKTFVDWLTNNFEGFFRGVTVGLNFVLEGTVNALLAIPDVILLLLITALSYLLQRSWKLALFTAVGLLLVMNFDLWKAMVETLVLVIYITIASLIIGVTIGIICARRPVLYQMLSPVLDLMQTLPTFVYLVPVLVFFGLGLAPALIASIIFVVPAPIRLTYLGISQVQKPLVEAGESFGCTRWQLLVKVKLPAAMPTIMAGVNQTIMLALSMAVIAALVGARGLGAPVVRALNQRNVPLSVEAGLAIVVLAIVLDRMLKQRRAARSSKQ
ncbi:glycine betaine/proline transport system permease protein [Dongia mobilis]|uniref:Glycine betaine/proline transport system permease protein n=1 Tax=Dongia mobilis TaxID=578943 RepID=A0A4R6WHD1_9PROT|nr:choline ABC transporter permease subunit [Dongia mobilis]TDQ77685.1 glycine betaine/proline transport system permease protein [Dongia mobilis]